MPLRTSADLEALIVAARHEYGWGAKKLRQVLRTRYPARPWPARSTSHATDRVATESIEAAGMWLPAESELCTSSFR